MMHILPVNLENALRPIPAVKLSRSQVLQRRMFNQIRLINLAQKTKGIEPADIANFTTKLNNIKNELGIK